MNKDKIEYRYSDDEILIIAIEFAKKGIPMKAIQKKFILSDDDIDLIEFIINEF
ncbi:MULTISPECIES: hypothetical protein [Bacillus]|uniref:hypothetical protein n=1 Tax=Bacillus TaxID=1386 RepID=UPI00148291E3|nr:MULTISPECIES: hypothetical protein [Bacillus]MCK6205765.1 hypothetical protein [Bacillus infantis]